MNAKLSDAKLSIEQMFEALAENTAEVFIIAEAVKPYSVIYVNPAVEDLFGIDRADVVGSPLDFLLAGGQVCKHLISVEQMFGRVMGWNTLTQTEFPIFVRARFVEINQQRYVIARIRDDRERSALQDALISEKEQIRAERHQLGALLSLSSIGLWTWDEINKSLQISDSWFEITGQSAEDAKEAKKMIRSVAESGANQFRQLDLLISWWANSLHPEDLEEAKNKLEQFLLIRCQENYHSLYRYKKKDGVYVTILSQGEGIWAEDGSLRSLFVSQVSVDLVAKAKEELVIQVARLTESNKELAKSLAEAQKMNSQNIVQLSEQLAPLLPVVKIGIAVILAASALLSDKFSDLAAVLWDKGAATVTPVELPVATPAQAQKILPKEEY